MAVRWLDRVAIPGGVLRPVLVLMSGATLAHAITALALPVLTRLYSRAGFSLLAIFSSVLAIIVAAACFRIDAAIPTPEFDSEALNLIVLSLCCALALSILVAVFMFFASLWAATAMGQPILERYLWPLPIGVLSGGACSALQNWYVREEKFSSIARSRVALSAACSGTQIGTAWLASAPLGLLVGHLLNSGAACTGLGYRLIRHNHLRGWLHNWKCVALKQTWADYKRFHKHSTCEALYNSAAIQLLIIVIAAVSAGPEAGYMLLAMVTIQAPMAQSSSTPSVTLLSALTLQTSLFNKNRLDSCDNYLDIHQPCEQSNRMVD